jgi:hypothetical protein
VGAVDGPSVAAGAAGIDAVAVVSSSEPRSSPGVNGVDTSALGVVASVAVGVAGGPAAAGGLAADGAAGVGVASVVGHVDGSEDAGERAAATEEGDVGSRSVRSVRGADSGPGEMTPSGRPRSCESLVSIDTFEGSDAEGPVSGEPGGGTWFGAVTSGEPGGGEWLGAVTSGEPPDGNWLGAVTPGEPEEATDASIEAAAGSDEPLGAAGPDEPAAAAGPDEPGTGEAAGPDEPGTGATVGSDGPAAAAAAGPDDPGAAAAGPDGPAAAAGAAVAGERAIPAPVPGGAAEGKPAASPPAPAPAAPAPAPAPTAPVAPPASRPEAGDGVDERGVTRTRAGEPM